MNVMDKFCISQIKNNYKKKPIINPWTSALDQVTGASNESCTCHHEVVVDSSTYLSIQLCVGLAARRRACKQIFVLQLQIFHISTQPVEVILH